VDHDAAEMPLGEAYGHPFAQLAKRRTIWVDASVRCLQPNDPPLKLLDGADGGRSSTAVFSQEACADQFVQI
jgi:hypothetical protein